MIASRKRSIKEGLQTLPNQTMEPYFGDQVAQRLRAGAKTFVEKCDDARGFLFVLLLKQFEEDKTGETADIHVDTGQVVVPVSQVLTPFGLEPGVALQEDGDKSGRLQMGAVRFLLICLADMGCRSSVEVYLNGLDFRALLNVGLCSDSRTHVSTSRRGAPGFVVSVDEVWVCF
jgi:hypothetical protein